VNALARLECPVANRLLPLSVKVQSAMITSAGAGLRWIDRPVPDLDEARADSRKSPLTGAAPEE
jgi:hypothetical protein